jgi:hypothetical protein
MGRAFAARGAGLTGAAAPRSFQLLLRRLGEGRPAYDGAGIGVGPDRSRGQRAVRPVAPALGRGVRRPPRAVARRTDGPMRGLLAGREIRGYAPISAGWLVGHQRSLKLSLDNIM